MWPGRRVVVVHLEKLFSGGGAGCCGAGGVGALAVGVLELVVSVLDVDEVVEALLSLGDDGGLLVCAGLTSVSWGAGWRGRWRSCMSCDVCWPCVCGLR